MDLAVKSYALGILQKIFSTFKLNLELNLNLNISNHLNIIFILDYSKDMNEKQILTSHESSA